MIDTSQELNSQLEELENRLAAQKAELQDLAMMGTVITSIHEIDSVLSVVMDMSIRQVDGEVGFISLYENDQLVPKITWGVPRDFAKTVQYSDDKDLASYCFENRQSMVLCDLNRRTEQGIRLNTILALPIATKDRCFGVLAIINRSDGSNFTSDNKDELELLLRFVAVAIDNSHLLKDRLKQQQIEQEMQIARQVQSTILPQDIGTIDGVDIGVVYVPARDVGGDFYDLVQISENRFLVVVGDVSNKGVPAALVMSAASGILRTIVEMNPEVRVAELASQLNNLLSGQIIKDREMFVTLFLAICDTAESTITFCNAGHLPGLLWAEDEGELIDLSAGGTFVGQFPDATYLQETRRIAPGDRVLLFTDGLTEAENRTRELFGRERVASLMKSLMNESAMDGCRAVKAAVDRFSVGAADDAQDDFTVLQIHWQSIENKRKVFVFNSVVQEESRMLDEVFTFLDFHGVEPAPRQRFAVVVSEAFSNALIHGNELNPDKKITLSLSLNHRWLRADIEDEGQGGLARIHRKSQPTMSSESGRGVDLIRHYAQAEFTETARGGLRVTVRMQIASNTEEAEK